ncbi:MAG TPA: substrate-binding domain-containing protein [Spirochaetia bacterium]|nr:substrate-binding domain-containing protein [Spirochaetia bacterium]
MKFLNVLIAVLGLVVFSLSACKQTPAIRLATTTSLEQSGLLAELIEAFTKKYHISIQIITVGSGAALELGKNGDVDVIIAHAPKLEKQFMDSGYGLERDSFLYSRFVVLGPIEDPAHIASAQTPDDAFRRIARYNERGKHKNHSIIYHSSLLCLYRAVILRGQTLSKNLFGTRLV